MLEEPAPGTTFVLTSSEPGRLLDTIRSRSVSLHLGPLPTAEVAEFLVDHTGVVMDEAQRAARLGRGSIGRALGFLDQDGEHGPEEVLRREGFKLLRAALGAPGGAHFHLALARGTGKGRSLSALLDRLEEWLRDLAALAAGADSFVVNTDARDALGPMVGPGVIDPVGLAKALAAIHEARSAADGNANPPLVLFGLLSALSAALRPSEPVAPSPALPASPALA